MAELDSDNSSDGTLVIDEPNYDCETIEITDSDVEVVEITDDEDTSSKSNFPSSSTKSNLTCKVCYRIFSTNNNLLNHIRKFKGRIGGCMIQTNTNVTLTFMSQKTKKPTPEHKPKRVYKKKKCNSSKISSKQPVPQSVPICPELIPVIFEPVLPANNGFNEDNRTNNNSSNNLPSLRQILVEEVDPEYPCTECGQIFRHYIGLVCHLNSEHHNGSLTKSNEEKQIVKKKITKENKQIENHEPVPNVVDLTLLPDSKKDTLLSRMKSYLHSPQKFLVVCVLCNMEFKNSRKALSHIEDKHVTDKIACGYCNMKFVFELKLRSHMAKRHNVIGIYKCDKCLKMINQEERESHPKKCKGNTSKIKTENGNN